MRLSQPHKQALLAQPLDAITQARFAASVEKSLQEQQQLDASDQGSFEDYVARYYA